MKKLSDFEGFSQCLTNCTVNSSERSHLLTLLMLFKEIKISERCSGLTKKRGEEELEHEGRGRQTEDKVEDGDGVEKGKVKSKLLLAEKEYRV